MSDQMNPPLYLLAHVFQACSILLFLACLTQKAYYLHGSHAPADSLYLLVIGAFGLLDGIFAWYANPVLFLSYLFFYIKRFNWSILLGFLALLLMASFFLSKTMIVSDGGTRAPIIAYGLGFWLWMASAVVAIVAGCLGQADQET